MLLAGGYLYHGAVTMPAIYVFDDKLNTMNIDKNWWELNPKWQHNIIPANGSRCSSGKRWLFLLLLLAVVGFVLYDNHSKLLSHFHAGEYLQMTELVVIIFPLLFVAQQIKKSRQYSRFGEVSFVMDPFPAIIGEKFGGYLEINKGAEGLEFMAELLLMEQSELNEGDNRNTQTDMIWKRELSVHTERAMLGVRLLIDSQLPDDKPPSQPQRSHYKFWRLYVYSSNKKFKQTWDVPIIAASDYV